jgi:hypothetical protein
LGVIVVCRLSPEIVYSQLAPLTALGHLKLPILNCIDQRTIDVKPGSLPVGGNGDQPYEFG